MSSPGTELLKKGRIAATEVVTRGGRRVVRKTLDVRPRIPFVARELSRWLARREYRALRWADGIPGIPRAIAMPKENVFYREYVPGTALPRAAAPAPAFFEELAAIARALHARGITHNDLHKEANVIVTPEGRPALLDFQLALRLPRGSALFRVLAAFDLYHVAKNRRHRTGEALDGEAERLFRLTRSFRRAHRLIVKKPMNLLTKRLFPRALGKLPTDTDP